MELGVSYIASHIPEHIRTDMKHLKEIGCTEVLFALQENHIEHLTGALTYGASIAKEKGLTPYAVIWGYANTFGGGTISKILLENIDMLRIRKNGEYDSMACLNNPKLVDKFVEIAVKCRENGFEGVFVDEPTFQECFCKCCQDKFKEKYNRDIIDSAGTSDYEAFQKDTVGSYTEKICRKIKEIDDKFATITCIMPHDSGLFERISGISGLDIFGTDPYWLLTKGAMTIEAACAHAENIKNICRRKKKKSQVWLNCWKIPAGLEEDIYTGGKKLAAIGCDSLYTWSYRGGIGTNEECDNPARAWDSVVKLYRELSG